MEEVEMGFFGKKDERRLPDLPSPIEAESGVRSEGEERHTLPTFPDSPMHNRFSEAMIKDAISTKNDDESPAEASEDEKKIKVVEMDEWKPSRMEEEDKEEAEEGHERFMPPEVKPFKLVDFKTANAMAGKQMPVRRERLIPTQEASQKYHRSSMPAKEVFVKIDKYYTARKAMAEIAGKLEEIDGMVRKIREVKMREEQELASWERDIMQTKARIQEINENLFDKTE